jgi:hypothetical protein
MRKLIFTPQHGMHAGADYTPTSEFVSATAVA